MMEAATAAIAELGWPDAVLAALLVLFAYPFAIYPPLIRLLARGRRPPAGKFPEGEWPEAALIICALNEEGVIGEKIENSLALDYPEGKLRVVVVDDGSTDATGEIARRWTPRIELIRRERRRGKVWNLNRVIASRSEPVVVLSDANVMYARDALRRLVARLAAPEVGCASGKVALVETAAELEASEKRYYSIEWAMQEAESAFYSMVGADGAMYALKRALFRPVPDDTIIEDLVIPVQVVRQGRRVVFAPDAVGVERGVASLAEEFRRKVRIAAGAAQALVRGNGWPKGAPWRFWFVFVSHKLLRWVSPIVGLAALGWAGWHAEAPLSRLTLAGAAAVGLAALARWAAGPGLWALDAPFYFVFGQCAQLVGFLKGLAGRQSVLWAKADR